MGARFHRWLIRPSTLHFLRHLVGPVKAAARRPCRAISTTSLKATGEGHTAVAPGTLQPLSIQRVGHTAEEALALSAKELGLHMSLRAGVSILGAGEDLTTSLDGAASFEALRYQADVSAEDKRGDLLVDQDEHRQNLRLWIELLHFRQRLDGLAGIVAIWQGMRMRDVQMPTDGEEADILWAPFVQAMISQQGWGPRTAFDDLYASTVDSKRRTGQHYDKLYDSIVGSFFRINPSLVRPWHKRLSEADITPSDALLRVAKDAVQSQLPFEAFKRFRQLYHQRNERNLYNVCVDAALQSDRDADTDSAISWHRFLITSGDAPSPEMFARPEVQRLFEQDGDASLPMVHVASSQHDPSFGRRLPELPKMSRASMSSLVGDVHGIKPKEISDAFVAKMFATRAFPLDLLIRGLSFFALDRLGPVAVREMAVRTGTPVEFCNQLSSLKAMKIGVSDAPYCRLIQSLANDGQTELFNALLASDQHPEAYEDTKTQEALLVSFLEAGNWTQAHITLLCLSLAGAQQQADAWNRVVQHYLRQRQHRLIAQTIQHLQDQKAPLTFTTLTHLHRYLLPVRRRRMRPIESQRQDRPPFNALDFVTNACMYADDVARNANIPQNYVRPRVWTELLKRYGMTHRWPQFTKLALWLAEQYSGPRFQREGEGTGSAVRLRRSCPLHFIFSKQTQQAVFTWGFRSAAVKDKLRPGLASHSRPADSPLAASEGLSRPARISSTEIWAQGLILLLYLRSRGVNVSDEDVRQAFRVRMWILFGPGHSTVAINEMNRRVNRLSLAHYIRTANDIWPGGLININPMLLDDDPQMEPLLLLAYFGLQMGVGWRKADRSNEYVDVRSWAADVSSSQWSNASRGRTARQRHWVWERSPFRFAVPKGERKSSSADEPVTEHKQDGQDGSQAEQVNRADGSNTLAAASGDL
ncbi:hypothetical protein LTR85_011019 [Meristemomyces frigidus]|nr:hypothetical protein LTR85_011019 [Meristemomyces frigidus]